MENSNHKHGGTKIGNTVILLVLTSLMAPIMASATEQGNSSNDNGSSEGGCYNVGYENGQNDSFSEDAFQDNCGPLNSDNRYYQGFIDGCMSVEGNTREVCESSTDAWSGLWRSHIRAQKDKLITLSENFGMNNEGLTYARLSNKDWQIFIDDSDPLRCMDESDKIENVNYQEIISITVWDWK